MKNFVVSISFLCFFFSHLFFYSQGEPARQETKLDQVYEQFALSGEGTIIAIIDRGIDYFHPDFIDENGNTRLLYLYDMINPEGANDPNNPYGIGTIFNEDEINSSLASDGPPLSMDRFGHGTATTGIAGGNGTGTESGEFHGVAPKTKFIIVKATQDYFPAFDGHEGQDGFYNPTYIPIALQFVADNVENIPSVTLINMGSIGGPTDGTSTISRAMNDFVESGKVLVCGVGDDGGAVNHSSTTIDQGETIELKINKSTTGFLRLDLWYDESDRFEVTITRPDNGSEGPFPAPMSAGDSDDRILNNINYYHRGADVDFFGATSNRRELLIDFNGPVGEYIVSLKATSIGASGKFNATLNPSTYNNQNEFTTFAVDGYSINDFASAEKVITPGDYVVKNDWVDMDGNLQQITGQGNEGELWIGSSWGPTHDGRMGIDFSTCGEVLYAAYSPNTWYSHFPHLLIEGGEYQYGIQNAVSAAAPLATGVISLMLEMNSDLNPSKIKEVLQQTSRNDSFTGSVPNNQWGYGKLDALAAIEKINATGIASNRKRSLAFRISPNPSHSKINLIFDKVLPKDIKEVKILNSYGYEIFHQTSRIGQIEVSHLPNGIYLVVVNTRSGSFIERFLKL